MSNNKLLNINDYSDPGTYKQDAAERGIGISLQFCLSVSKIMEKYMLTFPDACHFLEEKGFLFWTGDIPVYNMAGDVLWINKEQQGTGGEKVTLVQETKAQSIFNPEKEIQCKFFTLVIRNKAIEEKYKGGLKVFVDKYLCEYNNDLTTMIAMDSDYLDEPVKDIEESGLTCGEAYTVFDAFSGGFSTSEGDNAVELDVDWLKGHYSGGGAVISYST